MKLTRSCGACIDELKGVMNVLASMVCCRLGLTLMHAWALVLSFRLRGRRPRQCSPT